MDNKNNTIAIDQNNFVEYLQKARTHFAEKNFEQAAILFHHLIDAAPNYGFPVAELWVELSWSYFHMQRYESVVVCLSQLEKNNLEYAVMEDVHYLLGVSHMHLGRTRLSMTAFQSGLNLIDASHPKYPLFYFQLGQLAFTRGEYSIAEKHLNTARDFIDETDTNALESVHYLLGFALYYLKKYDEAEMLFDDLINLTEKPENRALGFYGKSFVCYQNENYEPLVELITNVYDNAPEFADKETMAFFLCLGYKAKNDAVNFNLFFEKLLADYPEGRYADEYEKLRAW
jgi:tetratricopeptide (TPR) repeat protein